MPTFCRHNRFIERCPICSKTLPGNKPGGSGSPRAPRSEKPSSQATRRGRIRGEAVRVRREGRAEDDGYRSALVPGIHASADASRLAEEIAFAHGCLLALGAEPPGLYGEVRALAAEDLEQATWTCFLIAYLSPLEGDDPFAGIRTALAGARDGSAYADGELGDLDGIPLGPRTSHDPARGASTLLAYRHWAVRAGGQAQAFEGDPEWSPQRRFERCFERLALAGFGRMGRYDLLIMLGGLGLYRLRADSLHFTSASDPSAPDPATLAAKRMFAIGDPLILERRAHALAEAIPVPVESLDLALWNWSPPAPGVRATLGFPSETCDLDTLERSREALEL